MANKSLTSFNEINSLEYGTIKIIYEALNKRYRHTQNQVKACNFRFKREMETLKTKIENSEESGSSASEDIVGHIKTLYTLVNNFKSEFNKSSADDLTVSTKLCNHIELLKNAQSSDPLVTDHFKKQRLDRLIIDYLLRTGHFETAQKLANYDNFDIDIPKNVYHVAKQVEQSLAQHNLSECLSWVKENSSRLHRIRSNFETEVQIQHCVELIKQGKQSEALNYARMHFGNGRGVCKCCNTNSSTEWDTESTTSHNLRHLMGLVGLGSLGPSSRRKEHIELLSVSRYDELIEMFKQENARIYNLSSQSPFSACLQAGIAVHKTPNCQQNGNPRCIVCNDVYELADGLPVSHSSNSRLFCSISGDPFDEEENRPMILPNGNVYGEKSIKAASQNNEFVCPRTLQVFDINDLKRVYVF